MKPNAHLDFYEKMLPQHVSRAIGDRLTARKQKKSQMPPHNEEESPAEDAGESPDAEQQEESGIAGAAQEDAGQSAVPPTHPVYMMPSEKAERATLAKRRKAAPVAPPKMASLKPRVLGR